MIPIDIRYWIRLHRRSQPMETDDKRNFKYDRFKNPDAQIITESIYPTYHEFENDDIRKKVNGELSDAMRAEEVTRLFNKIDQYNTQVMRKKSKGKPKIKKCKC